MVNKYQKKQRKASRKHRKDTKIFLKKKKKKSVNIIVIKIKSF